jgi:hypothetical protein
MSRDYVPTKHGRKYGDVTIAGEGLQNLGLCSVLRAIEQGGIFIVPHGASVFRVSSEGPPHLVMVILKSWIFINQNAMDILKTHPPRSVKQPSFIFDF